MQKNNFPNKNSLDNKNNRFKYRSQFEIVRKLIDSNENNSNTKINLTKIKNILFKAAQILDEFNYTKKQNNMSQATVIQSSLLESLGNHTTSQSQNLAFISLNETSHNKNKENVYYANHKRRLTEEAYNL